MHYYVSIFDANERESSEPVCDHEAFGLVEMVAVQDVLDGPVPAKIMCPIIVPHASIKPGLEDDVMVPDDCLEALLAHKETQRLHGILSAVAEVADGVEDVRIRIV